MLRAKLLFVCLLGLGNLIMISGCGESSSPSSAASPPPGARRASVRSSAPSGLSEVTVQQVHAASVDAAHRSWSAVVTARSTRSVTLLYLEGKGAGCSRVYRANITESESWVEIQLLIRPGDPSQPCAQVGARTLTTIQLDKNLGSRQLLEPSGGT